MLLLGFCTRGGTAGCVIVSFFILLAPYQNKFIVTWLFVAGIRRDVTNGPTEFQSPEFWLGLRCALGRGCARRPTSNHTQ